MVLCVLEARTGQFKASQDIRVGERSESFGRGMLQAYPDVPRDPFHWAEPRRVQWRLSGETAMGRARRGVGLAQAGGLWIDRSKSARISGCGERGVKAPRCYETWYQHGSGFSSGNAWRVTTAAWYGSCTTEVGKRPSETQRSDNCALSLANTNNQAM